MGVKEKFHKIWEKRPRTSKEAQTRLKAFVMSKEGQRLIIYSTLAAFLAACGLGGWIATRPQEGQPLPPPEIKVEPLVGGNPLHIENGRLIVNLEKVQNLEQLFQVLRENNMEFGAKDRVDLEYTDNSGVTHRFVFGYNAKKPEIPMFADVRTKPDDTKANLAFSEFTGEQTMLVAPTADSIEVILKAAAVDIIGFDPKTAVNQVLDVCGGKFCITELVRAVTPNPLDKEIGFDVVSAPVTPNDRPRYTGIIFRIYAPISSNEQGAQFLGMKQTGSLFVSFETGKVRVDRFVEASFNLSPESQDKIVNDKIKRYATAFGVVKLENVTIRIDDSGMERLVQLINGKEVTIGVFANGKETPYKLWKMQTQNIQGTMIGAVGANVLEMAKIVGGNGNVTHTWDADKQEWVADRQYLIESFEVPKDHADWFWFNQRLSSNIINDGKGRQEEVLFGQMNCYPISRRYEIEPKSGAEMLFVDCIIQAPSGQKRMITLIFHRLAIWENPGLVFAGSATDVRTNNVLLELIDTAIKDKKQIGVDVAIAHRPSLVQKPDCGIKCASTYLALDQQSKALLEFYFSAGEKKTVDTLTVLGIYKKTQEKEDFAGKDVPNLRAIWSSRGWDLPTK